MRSFECCDRYTVLCDGKWINSGYVKDIDKPELIKMIIGREPKNVYPPKNEEFGETLLEVKNLTAHDGSFRDVSLSVRAGGRRDFRIAGRRQDRAHPCDLRKL